jgi:hypothetical protein
MNHMGKDTQSRTNKAKKTAFSQPMFTEERLKKSADIFHGRRKYDEGYGGPDFDEWTAAFTIDPADYKTRALFLEFDLNAHSPYHWRALLEAFIRDYVKYRGRPKERSLEKLFRFALDVIQIHVDHLKDDRSYLGVAAQLQKIEPYRTRYREINLDILRKDVKEVTDLVGPMDDDALMRLAKLGPDRFMDAFLERAGVTEEDLRRWD